MSNKKYSSIDKIVYNRSMEGLGIEAYNVRSVYRSALGVGCIVLGFTTSFIPFTSIPLYILGGGLLGVDVVKLYYTIMKRFKYEFNLFKLRCFK